MKILHAAHLPFWSGGVAQQMAWEQEAARQLQLEWHSRVFIAAGSDIPASADEAVLVRHVPQSRWLDYRRAYYEWLARTAPDYDLVLLRYSNFNPLQLRFLRTCPVPVVTVHHALEVPELRTFPRGGIKAMAESAIGPFALRQVAGIAAVTDEIVQYELGRSGRRNLPSFLYPNGTSGRRVRSGTDRHPVPRLLFVASRFASWQGLDRLIETVSASKDEFVIDLVGEVEAPDREACKADPRFVLHGTRDAAYIEALAEQAWVGLTSFALDRVGMKEASTLKVREYLGSGLPVYSGHRDIMPVDFPYYRVGACEMNEILDFARTVSTVSPEDVAMEAKPYIDKASRVHSLYNELTSHFSSERS